MEIVRNCQDKIADSLAYLKKFISDQHAEEYPDGEQLLQTQNAINVIIVDRDKNLEKILDQQASIKSIIHTDDSIRALRESIRQDNRDINNLRKSVAKIGIDTSKFRSDLLETQAKDVERFHMHQLKSIAEDHKRHQDILEYRKKEVADIKKEIEHEENTREAYLADCEKKLQKEIQVRQNRLRQGDSLFPTSALGHDSDEPNDLQLTSINEYAPYGTAGGSKTPNKRKQTTRGRGRRRGGANASTR